MGPLALVALAGLGVGALFLATRDRGGPYIGPKVLPGQADYVQIGDQMFLVGKGYDGGTTVALGGTIVFFDVLNRYEKFEGTPQGVAIIRATLLQYPNEFKIPASVAVQIPTSIYQPPTV